MLTFDPLYHPYPAQRAPVFGNHGMVATSQPLAAQAGLDILKKGGNAIDAAIATAACLTVVEPTSNGIGGDAFALVWTNGKLHGLNGSGFAPQRISSEKLRKQGYETMPAYGWIPVTVPGAPAAWTELSSRFGKLPFSDLLKPAIQYAEKGYPVSPILGKFWRKSFLEYKEKLKGEEFANWFKTFAPSGRAPYIGEVWRSVEHAKTLQSIADSNAKSFYSGELAEKIDQFSHQYGGYLRGEDLANYAPQWVEPICVNYRGFDVWEIPPNGQGIVALMALNILKGYEFSAKDTVDTYHKQIEAMKLAFADGRRYIADAAKMTVTVDALLSDAYGAERRALIGEEALMPQPGKPQAGGTVYLAAADGEGNMVSFIQSNYMEFGSGLVVPGTGISLHNRGHNFSLDPAHDNCVEPGKKPYHTIIPGFLTKDSQPIGPFGVMGGFMQPQGHLQVIMNTIDFQLNPQAALNAPRWQWKEGKTVEVEHTLPLHLVEGLVRLGHDIKIVSESNNFGRGQMIWKNEETDVLVGATEPRTDGTVAVW